MSVAALGASVVQLFRRRHTLIHAGLLAIAFLCSASVVANVSRDHYWRAVALGSVATLCAAGAAVMAHRDIRRSHKLAVDTVTRWIWRPGVVNAHQASVFVQGILFPRTLNSRIRETVSPLARSTEFRTVYTLRLPRKGVREGALFVPFMVVRKGRLFDNLQIEAADGAQRASLSYSEYLQLVSIVLRHLARVDGRRTLKRYVAVEEQIMTMIADRAPAADADEEVDKLFDGVKSTQGAASPALQFMTSIVKILVVHYAVVVKMPISTVREDHQWEILTTIERRLLPLESPKFSEDFIAWMFDRFRKWFGVRPNQFALPIENAHRTPSYHLEFVGPPDTYLARQSIQHFVPDSSFYLRMRPRFGQRYSHLYLRDAPNEAVNWRLRLSFFERPPGSVGIAAVTALASLCLIFIAGRLASTGQLKDVPGDVTAVLLAVPVVSSAWIGLERGKVPFGGTTATRLSSLVSFLSSLSAASLYLGAVGDEAWLGDTYELLGTKGVWVLLIGLAALNCSWIYYGWLRRSVLYSATLAKQRGWHG